MKKKPLKISWRSWCLYKLAGRDYSAYEMSQLIEKRAAAADQSVDPIPIVEELVKEGAIDDTRYIESQISMSINSNQVKGPLEIRRKLKTQGGISNDQLEDYLQNDDSQWDRLARKVRDQTLASHGINADEDQTISVRLYHNLKQKLFRKGFTREQIQQAVEGLIPRDEKPAQMPVTDLERQVEKLILAGKGPLNILHQLKQKGAEESELRKFIDFDDDNWIIRARDLLQKRKGSGKSLTQKDKKKLSDFLLRRGFLIEHIKAALID